uniref:FAT atypical cadherin 1b n=1 Tax=Esox lucius TaxID=8010 RepID=A0A3P8XZ66_ESOLU
LINHSVGRIHGKQTPLFQFTQTVYNTTIYENSAAKSYVECPIKMGIYITDQPWDIQYKIESGDGVALFKAEEYVLGDFSFLRIRTKGGISAVLNREVKEHYSMTVKALQRSTNAVTQTRVQVRVLDTNDLRPLFSRTSYSVSVPENAAIRTTIVRVTATDADIGTNGEYYFSLRGERTDMFAIHPTSGVITLMGKLHYAEQKLFEMDVLAVDRGRKLYESSESLISTARLIVSVLHANEHAPILTAVPLVPSKTDTDPIYALVTVGDNDQGSSGEIASLSIVAGDPLRQFRTVRRSPGGKEYSIKAIKDVDWDSCVFGCNLTLQAKDKGSPPKFSSAVVVRVRPTHVDVRAPSFQESVYRINLTEFAPPNTSVVVVRATPYHPMLKYSLKYPKIQKETLPFDINSNTGLITTTAALQADYASQYEFEVIINQGKASTRVVVEVLDMNNNAPVFQEPAYKGSVDENVPVGTSLLTVSASDLDDGENGFVTYAIVSVNTPQPFTVDYFTGVISTARELDYEQMPRVYNLRVRASDRGSPFCREVEATVAIALNNINDNEPLFEKIDCEVNVPRYYRVGEQIISLSAIDVDDMEVVQYVITGGNSLGLFDLAPDTGVLSLTLALHDGDAARLTFHSLEIVASDGEISSKPMFVNITVLSGSGAIVERCVDTGVVGRLAEKLLFATKLNSQREPEDHFEDVHSINNYSPQFVDSAPNIIDVKEDLPVGTRIAHLSAVDADCGFSGTLMFVISGGNVESRFMIEMDTGWLKILESLDRETTDQYTLNITVFDLGKPQGSASHVLQITVLDSNDNSPHFLQSSYSLSIREDTDVGTAVIQVDATDKDSGANGIIRYSFMAKSDHFAIDEQTGVVMVKSPLDRELNPTISLKVVACDQAEHEPRMISTVSLKVVLEDVNDNPPVFFPLHHRVKVREDLPVGTVVVWLQAHDPDHGQYGQLRFSLLVDGDGDFDIDKTNGAVRISRNLDFERRQVYNLTAQVKDKGKPESLYSTCFIEFYIVDVDENLHQPQFASFVDKGSVREDAPIGTSVMTVTAQDNDRQRAGEISYSVRGGSGLGVFTINEESGVIQTQELLDHETTSGYWLTIYATDLGVVPQSSFVEVYIEVEDINDNAPHTSEPVYYPEVMENSPKDVSVIQMEATDPDSGNSQQLSYKITGGNPQGFFSIDHQTGLVTTTSRKLDREQQEEHTLEITVTDKGVPARSTAVRVVVRVQDENDNTPQFLEKLSKIQLPERDRDRSERDILETGGPTDGRGEPIYRVIASDRDTGPNSELTYTIEEGDEQGRFFIEPKTGHVSSREVVSAGQYDILTIKVVDNGRPQRSSTCRLHIEWIEKPEPSSEPLVFTETSLSFSVMETDPVAHMVGVISTQPMDRPVWFKITGGNSDSQFDVSKGSGTLILAEPLHAEPKTNYSLTVEATDGTRSISTQVFVKVIDTNNHRPEFSRLRYEVHIPEDTAPETCILQLRATDKDDWNKLSFTLLSSTDPSSQGRFRLEPGTGKLYTVHPLDHEVMKRHTLTVMVRDEGVPVKRNLARVIVHVEDINDNPPWFTGPPYSGQVLGSASVGSSVLQVSALDRDKGSNAEIRYSIESGNEGKLFAIDPVLGTIKVVKKLDDEDKRQFELAVKASDRGEPPLSVVTTVCIAVTTPDNARPRFPQEEISAVISETAPVGSLVILVSASSPSSVLYQIREGNINSAFDINPNSGAVVIQRLLDYETVSSYRLRVQATNMADMVCYATVLVHLRDENDNNPVLTRTEYRGVVSESAPVNTMVLTSENSPLVIQATDSDSDLNGRLVYHIVEPYALDYFAIDTSTGAIHTVAGLDYEQRSEFNFTVQVHDSGKPQRFAESIARVAIHVTDVNDCPPKFSQDLFETSVVVPTYTGVKVISLHATDEDLRAGSKLMFSITDGNIGGKFMIDSTSGVILVQNPNHLRNRYTLTVRVSDGRFSKTALVKVTVRENKNSDLKFTQDVYTASVPENTSERKTLAVLTAVAARNKVKKPLFYTILNPQGRFEIGHTSGVLFTTGVPFDREEQDTFEVVVEVTKEERSSGVSHAVVVVTVEDLNDNEPVFMGLPYSVLVPLHSEVGQALRQVTTVDKDTGRNAEIMYQLKEDQGYFQISPSGDISLKRTIHPKDVDAGFAIVVVAKDSGETALSSTVVVEVTVLNKAVPVFEKSFYSIVIPEDVPLDTSVVQILANCSEGLKSVYSIAEGDPFDQFSISLITGVLRVIQPLDYESHPAYRLSVRATDSLTGAHSEVYVDVILEDVNDQAPTFKESLYEADVSESLAVDSPVVQVSAIDSDSGSNKVLFYQLVEEGGGASDHFSIDRDSGLIRISATLDYEVEPRHRLVVRAVDGGIPALSTEVPVIISLTDINDNPPMFTQSLYEATVSQLAPGGHFVARVRASDADLSDTDRLEYSLLSGNEDHSFTIDRRSGEIITSNHSRLDAKPFYRLSVSVSDGVYRTLSKVQVAVISSNLHNPFFSSNDGIVELLENSPVGTLVSQVTATDEDPGVYGEVTYYIVNDNAKDRFTISEHGEIFTVENLDRENVIDRLVSISLMAIDGGGKLGFTSLNVILTDVNDNYPQFGQVEYAVSIPQGLREGTVIVRVAAVDADEGSNADITYTLESEVGGFNIDPLSGDIITVENLMASTSDLFSFYVRATDGGKPPKQSVVPVYIRLLPKDVVVPKFQLQQSLSFSEDLPIGSEIDIFIGSEQPLIYNLVKGKTPESNQVEVFIVNTDSGKLKLAKRLDFETTKWYLLTLQAQSNLDPSDVITTANLHIQIQDVNDNSPQFESDTYRSFVVENLPKGTTVIQVRATDLDSGMNGKVSYNLDQKQNTVEVLGLFAVDEESGWVTTLKDLDWEKQDRYSVVVLATDRGPDGRLNATAIVEVNVVDVNDSPLHFVEDVFRGSVSEDIPVPSRAIAILRTTARDPQDLNKQTYCFITGGDPEGQFGLESSQGEWTVVVRRALDREKRDSYCLNVTATDGMSVTSATVEISVLDTNDNSPVCERHLYTQTVSEDTPEGRLILWVSATDADIQSNAQISYTLSGDGADYFSLDTDTGELRTLLPLDREERDAYSLVVRAEDGGQRYCQADVVITVGDVNDNAPEFTADPYTASVFENTQIGTYVAQTQAKDLDAGKNSKVLYSFEDSANGQFSIQRQSGLISLAQPLAKGAQPGYTLRVRATDQGTLRRLSSICSVIVSVLSTNDRPPTFQKRDYGVTVAEDVTVGTPVIRVYAASGDPKVPSDITYSIVNGNEHGMFSINPHTGDIFVIKVLDYEAYHVHYLTVCASANGTGRSDVATVAVYLTDVNDNSPVFSQEVYSAVIGEDIDVGLTVVAVMANDIDGSSNNHIHFSIAKGNQGGHFTIDAVNGEVKVILPLDREKVSAYTLTVRASDSGNPPRSSSALIHINVSDVNDNAPVFSQADYNLVIQENVLVGTSVLQLTVTDRDASHNGAPFSFTILGGDEEGSFMIDPQGTLRTTRRLDHTVKDLYTLHTQVLDSGRPPIQASTLITIRVIQESLHPPAVSPLDILISTPGEVYPGGVLGQIHATDQDLYDALTYHLQADTADTPFSLSSSDGRLVTRPGRSLRLGRYLLNVTVSDGRFIASTNVSVHVRQVTRRVLERSVAVRLASVAPEEFIGEHWRAFLRVLHAVAAVRRSEIQLVSLQPAEPPGSLDVLLALERSNSKDGLLLLKLNASVGAIQEATGLSIIRVFRKLCAGMNCPARLCSEMVSLNQNSLTTYSTARFSIITPTHHRSAVCLCKGGECPVLMKTCEGKPCPEGLNCVANQREGGFSCVCPPDKLAGCPGSHSLWFSGKGYIRYRLMENRYRDEMKLSLRLRTLSQHGTVMSARGTDYTGRLQYQFDCGSGPGLISIHSAQVSDGQWHTVSLQMDGNYAKLVLDQFHTASGTAPGTLCTLNLDGSLFLGGVSEFDQQRANLNNCLIYDFVRFNGHELTLGQETHAQAYAIVEEVVGVTAGCGATIPVSDCSSEPCVNGGTCSSLPHGGFVCKCTALFSGPRCEVAASPCSSNPCLYGGTCVLDNHKFFCQCRGQYSGPRCEVGPYCKYNPCKNKGRCIDSLDGAVCECEPGFQGERCLGDVDECMQKTESPCFNGGVCVNTYGAFNCSCVQGFAGPQCELDVVDKKELQSTSWSIRLEELLGLAMFLVIIFGLALLFVAVQKRAKQDESDEDEPSQGVQVNLDVPPEVPVRPVSYTPSYPRDSQPDLNGGFCEGPELVQPTDYCPFIPEPDPVPILRRGLAVCSVAPILPRRPTSTSPSDADSTQKPVSVYPIDGEKPAVDWRLALNCKSCGSTYSTVHWDPVLLGYHWDTSDWMLYGSVRHPVDQEVLQWRCMERHVPPCTDPDLLKPGYYEGGPDTEKVSSPPADLDQVPLSPLLGLSSGYDDTLLDIPGHPNTHFTCSQQGQRNDQNHLYPIDRPIGYNPGVDMVQIGTNHDPFEIRGGQKHSSRSDLPGLGEGSEVRGQSNQPSCDAGLFPKP